MSCPSPTALPTVALFAVAALLTATHIDAKPAFGFRKDTIAFANDTVFSYGVDEAGQLRIDRKKEAARYAHRCFVLARAILQFHKFAVFDPKRPKVSDAAYRAVIREVSRIPAWRAPFDLNQRIVVPGYTDLRSFSKAREHLLKEELGAWVPSYVRIGNWRLIFPHPRCGQALGADKLCERLDRGDLQAVYLARFPKMNHCVVLFDYRREKNGDIRFDIYDPNFPEKSSTLSYVASERSFEYPRRWYFPGGRVNLMRVYISPFH